MRLELKDLAKEYAKLVEKEKALEEKKQIIREQIKDTLKDSGISSAKTKYGMFTIFLSTMWEYSTKVKTKEKELRKLKELEKEQGKAKPVTTETIRFSPEKGDE